MKKFLALLLALVMSLSLVACGGGDDTAADGGADAEDGGNAETAAYQVAMITDYGDITDQSFNQTTYEACQEFCDAEGLQFEYYKPAGDSTAERVAMVDAAVADGYNVIVMPGYAFAETHQGDRGAVSRRDLHRAGRGAGRSGRGLHRALQRVLRCVSGRAVRLHGRLRRREAGLHPPGRAGRHGRSRRAAVRLWLRAGR